MNEYDMLGRKMEKQRKLQLSGMHICRFCLSSNRVLHSLYDGPIHTGKLSLQILSCISVEIFPSDFMPRFICERCVLFMDIFYEYKQICRQADVNLMKHIQKGDNLRRIPWPAILQKVGPSDDTPVITNPRSVEAKSENLKCGFCPRTFVKHAHFARHVETKHQQHCEQCGKRFSNQDDLIYHSAIHATQNLTCPLCMEKFDDVEAVTTHIKSHVSANDFMCDSCELVFLSNDKLEAHILNAHGDEIQVKQDIITDESSMEIKDDDDDESPLTVKEIGDEMVVEINKPNSFMLNNTQEEFEKGNNFSEDSEPESILPDALSDAVVITKLPQPDPKPDSITVLQNIKIERDSLTATILKKAEQVKRKVVQKPIESAADRKQKPVAKPDNVMSASNDKSLRLLEKELQELKRTNTRTDAVKAPVKPLESLRSRRPQITTSTPKPKPIEERKVPIKTPVTVEKKLPEKRAVTKENKEPKESKVPSNDSDKELKETDEEKDEVEKDKRIKKEVKETPKTAAKNGANDKEKVEEVIRRSNRPSKIKDYAKLVRDKPQNAEDETDEDSDDEEYREEKSLEVRRRRSSQKAGVKPPTVGTPATPMTPATPAPRKRGRPRKDEAAREIVPPKIKKEELDLTESDETESSQVEKETEPHDRNKTPDLPSEAKPEKSTLVSPSGQTLKQVPIKALPPGVKPLPLPATARQVGSSEVCEMQIGKKVVKVQKIMMTKAEVEAMAKKGLVEFKDGTMVLKQGIKLPADTATLRTSLVGDSASNKESPKKDVPAPAPTRCDVDEE